MRRLLGLFLVLGLSVLAPLGASAAPRARTTTIELAGLDMQVSARQLRRLKVLVNAVPGVRTARVDLATGELFITHTASISKRRLLRAAERAGFALVVPLAAIPNS